MFCSVDRQHMGSPIYHLEWDGLDLLRDTEFPMPHQTLSKLVNDRVISRFEIL